MGARNYIASLFLTELRKGLAVTGRHFFSRKITVQYPEEKTPQSNRFRGLHALRHSFASNLYARGVEVKIISKLLGHSSTQITIDRYVHLFEGDLDDTLRQAVGA